MVSMGRALMTEARLYLIDEPSLGLAPIISQRTIVALRGIGWAVPSTRIDGLNYALLTIGVADICRVSISQIRALAPQNSSIKNVGSFIPQDWHLQRPG